MSYQVLARKWRPRNFSTLVGQEHVVRALNHALTEQRLHHAYLFTGTRGVGKTTIARILAKSLNCETGITAHPCGLCSACLEIDAGRFVDLLEVDAATNTRVEEMRQLLENSVYAPTRGRFKVYVIDEVHMLSNSAFNAMLKTLEEPPEHVKFILATTDPQKIPVTVLSRCLQFNLKQMVPSGISDYLAHILNAEGIPYEENALSVLAKGAAGSMRDGLSLLDQAIAHGAGKVELHQVQMMLGAIDGSVILGLLESLASNDIASILAGADALEGESISFPSTLQEMAAYLCEIQLFQMVSGYQTRFINESEQLSKLAGQFSAEAIQLAYQIVIQGRQELIFAPDDKAGFMMVMLRLHAFAPVLQMPFQSKNDLVKSVVSDKENSPIAQVDDKLPRTTPLAANSDVVLELAFDKEGALDWGLLLPRLDVSGMAKTLAQHCELRALESSMCLLRLPPQYRHLLMKPAQDKIQYAMSECLGRTINLKIEIAEVASETPALVFQKKNAVKAVEAQTAIEQDEFVCEVVNLLGAEVVPQTVKPV